MADPAEQAHPRRRIDRVSAEDYLDGIAERTPAELRAMRDDCRDEEAQLSFMRRLLHARLDMVEAELRRRAGDEGGEEIIPSLSTILRDRTQITRDPAHTFHSPVHDFPELGNRDDEALIVDASISRLPELSDEEVAQLRERLQAEEARVSGLRRTVLDHLDRLQEELVARYRDGGPDLSEILAAAGNSAQQADDPAAGDDT